MKITASEIAAITGGHLSGVPDNVVHELLIDRGERATQRGWLSLQLKEQITTDTISSLSYMRGG